MILMCEQKNGVRRYYRDNTEISQDEWNKESDDMNWEQSFAFISAIGCGENIEEAKERWLIQNGKSRW